MRDLTAQVTSSLLPFPGVTVDALGEDEITLDSVLHGKFTFGRIGLAWLAYGPHLEVVHAITGERLSAYCFSGGGENPPSVLTARDFSWLKRSGLLVGLEEAEGSVLCLYDLGLSRVVKAVVIPGRIIAIEPLVSYGGASTLTQHLHQSLRWFFGIAAVVTDLGHVLLVDLCLDDLSCSQSELEASDLQVVTKSPAEIPSLREVSTRQGRHLCLQLNAPTGVGATAVQYISKTNQLAVGFCDGYLQLWNMKSLKKEYHSQLEGGRVPVLAFTFQEPENDPRNCCYLWAVQSAQDLEGDLVSLRLLQLAFSERKCLASGKILYEGLEYCEERYSQELSGSGFPLRAQATNTRLLSCQTIEKFRPHPDRDDSMNEVASPDTSVSIFTWQVKAYGQGTPSTYIGVFDINRWYHAQMPDSLRSGESLQNCPYLAVWSLDLLVQMVPSHVLLDAVVHDRSLSRGLPFTCPPPEQYFSPTTYNFDATCLLSSGIVHLTCSGYQKETLGFLKKAAPCSSDVISNSYSRCLMSGLLSSRTADTQSSSLSQEEQLDAILSTAVETSSLGLITGCIKQWTAEEQPGSALNLRYILDWAWKKVVQTKEELDGICAPLFNSSSNFTDPQTMQLLQHSQRLLGNLSTIFHCLLSEAQELTQEGLVGLMNKNMVSSLISKYAQVVLWFCRTGLLPEGSDEDALQISRPFYTHSLISNYYTIRREELARLAKGKWCADCLMIDGLVDQCGEHLTNLWKRDEGGTGRYPPPTLHALLDIYLLDNIDEATKHAIVIYLLLDVMYSFPNKDGASVESFPTAFAIPVGLVKLVQGLWLLDHNDHQSSFELLLHPATSQCRFEWQHERVLQALMCQGQHSVALRYFHVMKPSITSTFHAKLCLSVLLHNRCLIEAWSLLRQHSNHINMSELLGFLYESCQELGLIKELLKLPLGFNEQECLERFLQGTGGLQNRELLMVHYLQQANYIPALQLNHNLKTNLVNERDPKLRERSNTRNSILDQYGRVLPTVQRKLAIERTKPYQHPNTIHKEMSRPQPLSTITKRSASEKVMSRAGFINNVLTKIEEVWLVKGATPQSSPVRSLKPADMQSPKPSSMAPFDPFLGTPITHTSKRKSRLMDMVVHPSRQTPRPLLSPPRPPSSWVSPKSASKAPEFSLLQTPQVVKRARALAASGTVFSAFTPQSILRSSLRPTPVATPSASPGRSITPPLRTKESRITFIEMAESPDPEKGIQWTNGMAGDGEISLLNRGLASSKSTCKTWSSQPAEDDVDEDEVRQPRMKLVPPESDRPSSQLTRSESGSTSIHSVPADSRQSDAAPAGLSLSFDTSQVSVRSADTTLEYYDAPLSQEQRGDEGHAADDMEDEVVSVKIIGSAEKMEPEEEPSPPSEQVPHVPEAPETEKEESEVGGEQLEDDIFDDVLESFVEQNPKNEDELQCESDDELEEELQENNQVCYQVSVNTDSSSQVQSQDQPATDMDEDIQSGAEEPPEPPPSNATEVTEAQDHPKPREATEPTCEQEDELERSTDLTDFVQRHLFDRDLSPPLTRSGIHSASQNEVSFNSESTPDNKEEDQADAEEAPTAFSSQKSTPSITSSEPTGTDSHSVVSLHDSEELSSPEEDEESDQEEEEEEEEEEEDSGSEVEIIEEVQGNGRLPPLQPSSVFIQQGHTHFLPGLAEQEASEFSLITPGAEMKMVDEVMEGEVVMVRLGAEEEGMAVDDPEEQGAPYVELKPSTTLLVPLELVEEQDGLVEASQLELCELPPTVVPDELKPETHNSFSLMLDMDEDRDENALRLQNDLQFSDPSSPYLTVEASVEPVVKPEIILLDTDEQHPLFSGDAFEEDQRRELDVLDEVDDDGLPEPEPVKLTDQYDLQTENTVADHPEESKEQMGADIVMLTVDQEPADLYIFGITPVVVDDTASIAEANPAGEQIAVEEDKVEGSGNDVEEIPPSAETETVLEEKHQDHQPSEDTEEEERSDEITTETETETASGAGSEPGKHGDVEEEEPVSDNQPQEQPVPDTPTSQKKRTPSTPTRRTTRGRTVSFVSPLLEEAEEPRDDGKVADSSTMAPASPSRTPRKSKEIKIQPSTPRRSTRKTQPEPPKDRLEEEKEEAIAHGNTAPSAPGASSPARQRVSQRSSSRSSRSGGEDEPPVSVVEIPEEQEDQLTDKKAAQQAGSKTPTPVKRGATQGNTPRRSSRRILRSSDGVPTPLQTLVEETAQDASESPVKRRSRKTKRAPPEMQPALLEEEEEEEQPIPSPARRTRSFLNIYPKVKVVPISLPQSAGKLEGETVTEHLEDAQTGLGTERTGDAVQTNSLRPTRSKLWDRPKEDLPLLDSPLEVDSVTPVADALIRRLQNEEEKQEGGVIVTKTTRTSKKRTRSSVERVDSFEPVEDGLVPNPEQDESSPGGHSFVYSPSRRTRANRTQTAKPTWDAAAPVTRSRRGADKVASVVSQDDALEENLLDVEKAAANMSKTRKTGKRTAKSKLSSELPPVAEVDLISPLPSPVQPPPRPLKAILEGDAPTSSMNLRRKRIMDTVFTKPVTRRRKL